MSRESATSERCTRASLFATELGAGDLSLHLESEAEEERARARLAGFAAKQKAQLQDDDDEEQTVFDEDSREFWDSSPALCRDSSSEEAQGALALLELAAAESGDQAMARFLNPLLVKQGELEGELKELMAAAAARAPSHQSSSSNSKPPPAAAFVA